jgi:cytochrome c oxidase subunit 3
MPGTTAFPEIEIIVEHGGGGGGSTPPAGGGGGNGDDGKRRRPSFPSPRRYYTAITLGILSILMFFMALASAYIVRKGSGMDWVPLHLPRILWGNTVVLLGSSFTMELARRRLSEVNFSGFRRLWSVTTVLGFLFLLGQIMAWRQLVAQGVFLSTNPAAARGAPRQPRP